MPAYAVEFTTDRGPQRVQFTLDGDRPLSPQVAQIVEELRQRGIFVQGGMDDELGAFWNGAELDEGHTPEELGINPSRPLELRIRRPAQPIASEAGALAPSDAPLFPKGAYAAALTGFGGA